MKDSKLEVGCRLMLVCKSRGRPLNTPALRFVIYAAHVWARCQGVLQNVCDPGPKMWRIIVVLFVGIKVPEAFFRKPKYSK